jgi:hypothetical protein
MSEMKFFYIRDRWLKAIVVNDRDGNFVDYNVVRGNPIACIAYERHTDPDMEGMDYILFALSIGNPKDRFEKARGREIAAARLNKSTTVQEGFVLGEDAPSTEVVRVILEYIADSLKLPRRVREAAQDWLDRKQRNQEVD